MNRICVSAMALVALAGAANAQTVDLRIIERTNQSVANSSDPLLEFAVQARVNQGTLGRALGGYNFNIIANSSINVLGEPESTSIFQRARISNDGTTGPTATYFTGAPWDNISSVGVGGLAQTYSYLAGTNSNFNGLINSSGGTFTNNPSQNEIGLIVGSAINASLLRTPGVDTNGNNNPDTYRSAIDPGPFGNPDDGNPIPGETAALDNSYAGPYFGAGQFIDVYRFRMGITNFGARTITLTLSDVGAQVFNVFLYGNGAWGGGNSTLLPNQITVQPYSFIVTPTPASVALMGLGGLMVARRRRNA